MANFTALNIEPDDQSDDEIDNTKEIQIEDALKLYQTALKLHSQGPASYPQAADAYMNLFKSDIFKYPEAVTEFERIYEHPELELVDASFSLDLEIAAGGGDASSLPQILYVAYKNHGQFILDIVKSRFRDPDLPPEQLLNTIGLHYQAKAAMDNFALALPRDESDTELWRRTARIALMLGSTRISRYCLEAAVEVDDDPTVAEVEPPSLEEGFAGEQLKEHLKVISDEVALSHPVMAPFLKKSMPEFMKRHLDPYPFLPDVVRTLGHETPESERVEITQARAMIDIPALSWTALGDALMKLSFSPQGKSGAGIVLRFPDLSQTVVESTSHRDTVEDQIMKDASMMESPIAESGEAVLNTPVVAKSDDQVVDTNKATTTVPLNDSRARSQSISLPTRKRSQSAAGIDTPEEDSVTQKRSKRIRNRDNTTEIDPTTQYAEQLKNFVRADEDVFAFVGGVLHKLGVDDLGPFSDVQAALSTERGSDLADNIANTAVRDLRDILRTWDDNKASTFQNANAAEILGSTGGANAGLATFLEHSKSGPPKVNVKPLFDATNGLASFASRVETEWMPLQDVVFEWLRIVLVSYREKLWPEDLKVAVVHVISYVDPDIYSRFQLEIRQTNTTDDKQDELSTLQEMTQSLFELHLDIYSRITNPTSVVPYERRVMTKELLDRWADLASTVVRSRDTDPNDELSLRYLWASVFYATMADDVSREHKVLCWSDMQRILNEMGKPTIELQNNAVIPEISSAAAEREVSRLTTMDFFYNLFQTDTSNPIAIIETLEPVLDPESAYEPIDSEGGDDSVVGEVSDNTPPALRDMWKFLKTGSTSLRLFLWQRLREAYFSIGYNTKVFSCYLKSIEIIVADLRSEEYVNNADGSRHHQLLLWLKALDDLLVRSLTIALNDAATCFEIIDERHIKSTCTAIAQLNRILHSAAIFDDEIRVGLSQLPQTPAYAAHGSFNGFINKLREMQVRTWALQYTMVKEAMTQNIELFTTPDKDLADFLALVHYSLGLRKSCKASNKIFLKMMKVEMIRLKQVDKWEDYLGQVLYDLYGIRLGVGTYLLEEHGCPVETLDRRTVLNIAEQVILLAKRIPMKDLLKHELRATIERMQTAIGPAKSTPQMTHNLRNLTEYLKTSIRPLRMYQALKGQVEIDSIPVTNQDSGLADKGWYFLQGMLALTKFRSQKRLGPGGQTDDMRVSATFMRLQLQYTVDHWETWYRLAQCFDFELEDEVMWTADKINNQRADLVRIQRGAIHCYIMALSTSFRNADDSFETAANLSEMYHDFGMRLYSSSREPFKMEAFYTDEFEKHFSGAAGMYKKPLHDEMSRYKLWKYAVSLFKRSCADRPNYWMNHFMIGKCLWKMYCKASDEWDPKDRANPPSMQSVLDAFVRAIRTVPKPRDSRQDPILEPHYKIVSIVHKLVMKGDMEPQAGANLLQEQPYKIRKGEEIVIKDLEEWEPFILEVLRHLRKEDKQHWQHRMIARSAHILYAGDADYVQASAAKSELRESIFTKTMHIQVWKPDAERPGRHCVYMERYVRFMVTILWYTGDKLNMEALVKRVRKKPAEFYEFNKVWNECCTTYIRLIRRSGNIPANLDDVFKNVPQEEFELLSYRITQWLNDPDVSNPAVDALREINELKKINANLMKSAPIDDLINDTWAFLYTTVGPTLPSLPTALPLPLTDHQMDGASDPRAPPKPTGPMSLNNLVMNMDGTQIQVPVTIASSEPRPRKIGISRREVLRKAEAAVNRPPEPPRAIAPSTARPKSEPNSAVVGTNAPASAMPKIEIPAVRYLKGGEREVDGASGGAGEESVPGSLHDSADDESDLSDVPDMDDAESAMIFPGLMKSESKTGESTPKDGDVVKE